MNGMKREELELLIRDLYEENRMLRDLVDKLEEQEKNMKVSLSLEETIQAFRDMGEEEKKKPKYEFNPFSALFQNAGAGSGTSADDGKADTMMNPDAYAGNSEEIFSDMLPEDGEAILDSMGEEITDTDDGR